MVGCKIQSVPEGSPHRASAWFCAEEVGDLQGEMGVVLAEEATMEAEVAVHDSGARRLLPGRSAWTVSPVCEPQLLR